MDKYKIGESVATRREAELASGGGLEVPRAVVLGVPGVAGLGGGGLEVPRGVAFGDPRGAAVGGGELEVPRGVAFGVPGVGALGGLLLGIGPGAGAAAWRFPFLTSTLSFCPAEQ